MKKCPYCAEEIKKEANICRHCDRDLFPRSEEYLEQINYGLRKVNKEGFWIDIIICPLFQNPDVIPFSNGFYKKVLLEGVRVRHKYLPEIERYKNGFTGRLPKEDELVEKYGISYLLNIRDFGLIEYGQTITDFKALDPEFIKAQLKNILDFANEVLQKVNYLGDLDIILALNSIKEKPLYTRIAHLDLPTKSPLATPYPEDELVIKKRINSEEFYRNPDKVIEKIVLRFKAAYRM